MKYDLSIVIPFFNEEENISNLITELNIFCKEWKDVSVEVLFVDDGSTDNSVGFLTSNNHERYHSRLIKLSRNFGAHEAVKAGIKESRGNYVTFIGADLQFLLKDIITLYNEIKIGYDIVYATKPTSKEHISLFSEITHFLISKYVSIEWPKTGADTFMISRKVADELNVQVEINSPLHLQIFNMGFRKKAIPCSYSQREAGISKWTFAKKIKLFVDVFVGYSFMPIRAISIIGIGLSLLGFLWAVVIIILKLFITPDMAAGYATLVSVMLFGFGLTNISLGVIAEYLWRTLDFSRGRKTFIIDEIIQLNR